MLQDVILKQPIISPWVGKKIEVESPEKEIPSEIAVHHKDSIAAITEDEVEIVTPPLIQPPHVTDQPPAVAPPSVSIYKDENVHPLSSRDSITDILEEDEQPKTVSGNAITQPEKPIQVHRLSPVQIRKFNRYASVGTQGGGLSSRYNKVKSVALEPSTPGMVQFRRALSVQAVGETRATLFGGNVTDVERILNRMAVAIKKDLDL